MDCPCLQHLQALIILAYTYLGMGSNRLWGITAILTHQARAMGLHAADAPVRRNERPSWVPLNLLPPANHHAVSEERRRAFWAIFFLSTHVSLSTGWSSPCSMEDIDLKLPCLEEDFQLSRESQARYFTQLKPERGIAPVDEPTDIWSRCVEGCAMLNLVCSWLQVPWDQSNPSARTKREMEGFQLADNFQGWWRSLPERTISLKFANTKNSGQMILLHGFYYTYIN